MWSQLMHVDVYIQTYHLVCVQHKIHKTQSKSKWNAICHPRKAFTLAFWSPIVELKVVTRYVASRHASVFACTRSRYMCIILSCIVMYISHMCGCVVSVYHTCIYLLQHGVASMTNLAIVCQSLRALYQHPAYVYLFFKYIYTSMQTFKHYH